MSNTAAPAKRYLTTREAGEYLGKSDATMRAHANTTTPDDFIPAIRDGKFLRFDIRDLDAYMDRKKDA